MGPTKKRVKEITIKMEIIDSGVYNFYLFFISYK